jgi:hypothetical protein
MVTLFITPLKPNLDLIHAVVYKNQNQVDLGGRVFWVLGIGISDVLERCLACNHSTFRFYSSLFKFNHLLLLLKLEISLYTELPTPSLSSNQQPRNQITVLCALCSPCPNCVLQIANLIVE